MEARIPSPALSVPGAFEAIQALSAAATKAGRTSGLTRGFTELVNLRVSQVNGCAVCLDMHTRAAKHYDEAALAALLTHVAVINVWNRLNVATAQQAGEWTAQWVSQEG